MVRDKQKGKAAAEPFDRKNKGKEPELTPEDVIATLEDPDDPMGLDDSE